jgi:cytochrome c biogenesis protein CcmG, thiol:disulfide interchange protein DsbE
MKARMGAMLARAALATLLLAGAVPAQAAAEGGAAPDFALAGRGAPVSLAAYRGKLVYLDFWASWCGPCKRSFPWMGELQKRYGAAGLQVVAINVDTSRDDAERFLAATPAGFVVAFDPAGATPATYAIKGMPSSILIDANGQVVHVHTGFNADTPAQVERQIERALHATNGEGKRTQ